MNSDYLMWVGSSHYPRYIDFIREARQMGCCKRLGHELQHMEPGKTRIFLAHDEGIVGEGFIFGYYVVSRIEVVTSEGPDSMNLPLWASEKCTPVPLWAVYEEEERHCGFRKEDGLYAVSTTDRNTLRKMASELDVKYSLIGGGFVPISPTIMYEGKHFRGALAIDGDSLVLDYPDGPPRFSPMSDLYPGGPKKKILWTLETEELLLELVEEMAATGRPRAQAFARLSLMLRIPRARVLSHYKTMMNRKEV